MRSPTFLPTLATQTILPCPITFYESGSYAVNITATKDLQTLESSKTITIRPITRSVIPKIVSVQEDGGAAVTEFSQPISLSPGGTGSVTLHAILALDPKAVPPSRTLAVLNRTTDQLAGAANGVPVTLSADTARSEGDLKIKLDPTSLVDKPNQLAVIDVWTSEQSVPPQPFVVITKSASDRGGSIGPAATGPNVEFPEYTAPRSYPDGFNPSDKVETRVARLYYYRDAHRVAQIVNRDVRSYNYVAVATARRQAEDARDSADQATDQRRLTEIKAVRAAQASRAAEHDLQQALDGQAAAQQQDAQIAQALQSTQQQIDANQRGTHQEPDRSEGCSVGPRRRDRPASHKFQTKITALQAMIASETQKQTDLQNQQKTLTAQQAASTTKTLGDQVTQARAKVENLRNAEAAQSDQDVQQQQIEDRARENQFRQEVAAAHEDPDTYAPAKPGSLDPVRQVSVSVIGEGEIQLRGPIKGINVIRTMINQIDAPVGQVRVGIHTVQINGEHADRMEKVAGRIQDYIDHSRFLTVQSAQLLRNAVVTVASRLAQEAQDQSQAELSQQLALCPDEKSRQELLLRTSRSQKFRDEKYVRAFFGEDFINELEEIDSEFLQSGNKLLSLHSMDTTSLASALFLLSIAKNEVREEILNVFQSSLTDELPQAEATYFEAGAGTRGKDHFHQFKMLASNAKFQSLRGFFNARVTGNNTINPLQREFIRLAQIFKSQLVTELELNQRIKERGLIEDRLGDYIETLRKQQRQQRDADDALRLAQTSITKTIQDNRRFHPSSRCHHTVVSQTEPDL